MNRCVIIGSELVYNGSKVSVDDLYNEEFNQYSDNQASEFYNETYLVNELYQYKIRD